MNKKPEQEIDQRLAKLMAQNNRLREVIEAFASRSQLQSRDVSQQSSTVRIDAFEEFDVPRTPRLKMSQTNFGGSAGQTVIQDNSWFPALRCGFRPLEPSPGWRCLSAHGAPIRLGFNLIGMDTAHVTTAVENIEQRQLRDRDFIPVFITDMTDFEVFRFRGYVFEYVPASIARAPKNRRAERHYLKKRLELIKAKWNLRDIIDLSD